MANFIPIAFFDAIEIAGSLRTRWGLFKPDPERPGLRVLRLRGTAKGADEADDRFGGYPVTTKPPWPELAALRSDLARRGDALLGAAEFGRISMEMVDPGAALNWHAETSPYFSRWTRAILPLRTNPATLMVCGTETASPGSGWLTAIEPRLPMAAINLGEHPWVWLTVDFRKKASGE